jgi:glycosyltransferase involved in cell wall biosynthesis
LVPVKGIDVLLQAAAHSALQIPGLHIHLIGEGPEHDHLRALANRLGIGEQVTLHGHVARERLPAYFRGADVLCVSSWHEMQPVVALEAGYFGLPVVGTAVGLLPELARHGVTTVPRGDVHALSRSLVGVASGDRMRPSGSRLQSHVRSDFLAERSARGLLALYSELKEAGVGRALQRRPVTSAVVNDVSDA